MRFNHFDVSAFFISVLGFQVDLGLLHKQVSERGLDSINESSCRFAMLFYRCIHKLSIHCFMQYWSLKYGSGSFYVSTEQCVASKIGQIKLPTSFATPS